MCASGCITSPSSHNAVIQHISVYNLYICWPSYNVFITFTVSILLMDELTLVGYAYDNHEGKDVHFKILPNHPFSSRIAKYPRGHLEVVRQQLLKIRVLPLLFQSKCFLKILVWNFLEAPATSTDDTLLRKHWSLVFNMYIKWWTVMKTKCLLSRHQIHGWQTAPISFLMFC